MVSSLPALGHYQRAAYRDGSSPSENSYDIPEMITVESDNDSLSSSTRSWNRAQSFDSTPRSIFGSYWSSPAHTKSLEANDDSSVGEAMARLQTLQFPLIDGVEDDSSSTAATKKIVQAEHKIVDESNKSYDDNAVDYQAALATSSPTRSPRRKILPTPPPSTSVSSSLIQPKRSTPLFVGWKKSVSTSALLKAPHQSCLRRTRYSCSAIVTHRDAVTAAGKLHHERRNNGSHDLRQTSSTTKTSRSLRDELKKSVSFFSQVSVCEFAVPQDQQRSQKGWAKQFV
mmetsp:Transcript_13364/g.28674  ORF Transcript_13364/g.28674 Transcript_13364/m.28674 type:complete len:285 (-) Transcript_13364:226-1080(-)